VTREEIENKVRAILIDDFNVPDASLADDATFRGTMKLDSLDVVDFIMLLQKDFGFKSSLDSYRELHTFERLIDFIHETLKERADNG